MTVSRHVYANRILTLGRFPHHLNNYVSLVAWMEGEFSVTFAGKVPSFNPLATERPEPGATNFNSVGVKNYLDLKQGVKATVDTLNNGNYLEIISCLKKKSAASTTLRAVTASPWGTSFGDEYKFVEGVRSSWAAHAFKTIGGS